MSVITSDASSSVDSTASAPEPPSLSAHHLNLSTELLSTIIALSLGSHFEFIMFEPEGFDGERHIMNLLLVSKTFYTCTVEVLYHLWGTTFIDGETR